MKSAIVFMSVCLALASIAVPNARASSANDLLSVVTEIGLPTYPAESATAGTAADVEASFDVGQDGVPVAIRVGNGPAALAAAVADAIPRWRFAKGPLARKLPKQGIIIFRFVLGPAPVQIEASGKSVVVVVPSAPVDPATLEVGKGFGMLAAKRAFAPFPDDGPRASGSAEVRVETDVSGGVVFVKAISGLPAYRRVGEDAAFQFAFRPVSVNGVPVRLKGVLVFQWRDISSP